MPGVQPEPGPSARRRQARRRRPADGQPSETVLVIDALGRRQTAPLSAEEHVELWVRVVHENHTGLVEFVSATRRHDGSLSMRGRSDPANYPPCDDPNTLATLALAANRRGEEAFATPLPRPVCQPGKRAAGPGRIVWVDIEGVGEGLPRNLVELRPHLLVCSGAGLHAYWRLVRELPPEEVESCNRRLALAVDGDQACTDRGRIMRLPGTVNHKRGKWCRALASDQSRAPVDPDRLRASLRDPEPPRPPRRAIRRVVGNGVDDLALISPPVYFRSLAQVEVPASGGYIKCPLPDHDEDTASCHVWGDAERGWWCFGCSRGGGIYDLASLIEGGPSGAALRGRAFSAARSTAKRRL